ncbi:hypothetical protein Pmar_PMAR028447, partial [Perkinsus marinus ATCC 50983]
MPSPHPTNATHSTTPFSHSVIAGGIAGMVELTAMYPLDVIKTRAMAGTGRQKNMFMVLLMIYSVLTRAIKDERIRIYRGMLFPLLSETPKRALKFSTNAQLRDSFQSLVQARILRPDASINEWCRSWYMRGSYSMLTRTGEDTYAATRKQRPLLLEHT